MLFNSYVFILVFLPITLLCFYSVKIRKLQLLLLFSSSIFFYCYWSTTYVFLMLFTVVMDFFISQKLAVLQNPKQRRGLLLVSICSNLGILGFFKYFNFFTDSLNGLFQNIGWTAALPHLELILPIGISFYTFQSMSYVIDVYRRTSDAHAHLLEFAGYVTYFPHQISGPLVRHNRIVPQLKNPETYFFQTENFWKGCCFFCVGLAKKVLLADLLGRVTDPLVTNMHYASNLEAWIAVLGYTLQLYFDFSGYSDLAVGLGLMMNIQFPQNFNSPYKSRSITEFWQRWHITLSSWLKDYLYIPLGGNRHGVINTYRNLLLTMVIGGFWHGANWTYLAWGFYHGILLAIERFFKDRHWRIGFPDPVRWSLTLFATIIGWVFFRAPSLREALFWLNKLFFFRIDHLMTTALIAPTFRDQFFFAFFVALAGAFFFPNSWEVRFVPSRGRAFISSFFFVVALMFMSEKSPFLYFQF